jgi:hypothetical protein
MPNGPKGEQDTPPPDDGKDPAVVSMGKRGGAARAAAMTPERRAEIAKRAASSRWQKDRIARTKQEPV